MNTIARNFCFDEFEDFTYKMFVFAADMKKVIEYFGELGFFGSMFCMYVSISEIEYSSYHSRRSLLLSLHIVFFSSSGISYAIVESYG